VDDVTRLLEVLDELQVLLASRAEPRWAAWIRRATDQIRRGDANGLDVLLAAFGGMGSLNDLVLDPANGNATDAADGATATSQVRLLASEAYRLASGIRRARDAG